MTTIITVTGQCIGQYSKEFQKIIEYGACKNLIDTVNINWNYNSEEDYYESNFNVDQNDTKEIHLPCIGGIKSADIKILFGEPNRISNNYWKYHTSPIDGNGFADNYLIIELEHDRLKKITATNCTGTVDYIVKNWEYQINQDYYETSFNLDRQGIKEVDLPCLKHIERQLFHNIFGKPNFSFTRTTVVPMQKIEWDDKGNQTTPKTVDNQIIIDRYFISSYSIDYYDISLLEVTFYPASNRRQAFNRIEVKNCQNIIDTLNSKLSFNDSLGYYQYEKKREYELIQDAHLYSSCLFGMDSSTVNRLFGRPSATVKETEWEYRMSDLHYKGQYMGNSFKFYFYYDGTLSNIEYVYSKPMISPSH